mmetsp:Transcript_175437/g.557145  ORF Transcript_175437/g.557145 Transcript_175437/m.557145 type:complete len:1037 (+) Transcript_175437:290-3400(+)
MLQAPSLPKFGSGVSARHFRVWRPSADGHSLLPYQVEGVQFGLRHRGRILLGDEMGLGKTAQALVLAAHFPEEWPLLVVCPSSLCRNWADEAAQWLPRSVLGLGESAVQVISKGSDVPRRLARVLIISYDLLTRHERVRQRAQGVDYKVVICDEAHFLKSTKSQRTRALVPVIQRATRAILLTGTPAVNNAAEVYPLLDALVPGLVPSEEQFLQRYCIPEKVRGWRGRMVTQWRGSARPDELHRLLLGTVMIRRLKAQVLTQLPAKRRQRLHLERKALDAAKMAEIDKLKKEMQRQRGGRGGGGGAAEPPGGSGVLTEWLREAARHDEEDAEGKPSDAGEGDGGRCGEAQGRKGSARSVIADMARRTCEAKMHCVADYVETVVQSGTRFLLFAHHHLMLDALQERLRRIEATHIRIDGTTPQSQRGSLVSQFQSDNGVQVALLSIAACGQGLNLQSASLVIFAELHWVVGQLLQAEDRAHRVGQTAAVNIQYLVAQGTLDDVMYETLKRKHLDTTGFLNGDRQALRLEVSTELSQALSQVSQGGEVGGKSNDAIEDHKCSDASGAKSASSHEVVADAPRGDAATGPGGSPGSAEDEICDESAVAAGSATGQLIGTQQTTAVLAHQREHDGCGAEIDALEPTDAGVANMRTSQEMASVVAPLSQLTGPALATQASRPSASSAKHCRAVIAALRSKAKTVREESHGSQARTQTRGSVSGSPAPTSQASHPQLMPSVEEPPRQHRKRKPQDPSCPQAVSQQFVEASATPANQQNSLADSVAAGSATRKRRLSASASKLDRGPQQDLGLPSEANRNSEHLYSTVPMAASADPSGEDPTIGSSSAALATLGQPVCSSSVGPLGGEPRMDSSSGGTAIATHEQPAPSPIIRLPTAAQLPESRSVHPAQSAHDAAVLANAQRLPTVRAHKGLASFFKPLPRPGAIAVSSTVAVAASQTPLEVQPTSDDIVALCLKPVGFRPAQGRGEASDMHRGFREGVSDGAGRCSKGFPSASHDVARRPKTGPGAVWARGALQGGPSAGGA